MSSSARRHSLPTSSLFDLSSKSSNGNGHASTPSSSARRAPTAPDGAGGGPLYLGLELALDRVQAVVLDSELGVVHSIEVELDSLAASSLPRTVNGVHHGPDGSATQPLELVLGALDGVLERLSMACDLGRVASVGGCAHSALVLLTPDFAPQLASIPVSSALQAHFADSSAFVSRALVTSLDTTTVGQRSVLVKAAASAGAQAFMTPLLLRSGAVQLLRLPWKKAERIVALAGLVESVLVGSPVGWETSTAVDVSGLWDVQAHEWSTSGTDLVAGGPRAGEGLRHRLGSGRRRVGEDSSGSVSVYLQERFGFSPSCKVTPFILQSLATYLSLCPATGDIALSFDQLDILSFPLPAVPTPSALYQTLPHPAQRLEEAPRFIGQLSNCNGHAARTQIMASYANASWRVFGQMVSPIVPPGGSLGFDDKLYTFFWPRSEVHPFGIAEGHHRFEDGTATTEFRDLRANPRCLIESQLLSLRARYSTILSAEAPGRSTLGPPPRTALSLGFDPFDESTTPLRVLVAESPMQVCQPIMGVLADVFGAPVSGGHRHSSREAEGNACATTTPSAASVGCAYFACWADMSPPNQTFEAFVLSILNARSSSTSRPTLRSRPSRSSLSNGSAVTLAAILESTGSGDDDPRATPPHRPLHRSKSAHHLSLRQNGAVGAACGRHSAATLTPLAVADRDAFRAYGSMLPEFLRLEELFVKGLVHPPAA